MLDKKLETSVDGIHRRLDEFMLMFSKLYQVSLPSDFLSKERSVPLLPRNGVTHRNLQFNLPEDFLSKQKADQIPEGIDDDAVDMTCPKQPADQHSKMPSSRSSKDVHDGDLNMFKSYDPVTNSLNTVKDPLPLKHLPVLGHGEVQPFVGISDPKDITVQGDFRFVEKGQIVSTKPTQDLSLEVEELDAPWSDLVLKERIGAWYCPLIGRVRMYTTLVRDYRKLHGIPHTIVLIENH